MADTSHTEAHAEVPAHGDAHGEVNLFNPQPTLVGLTWLTFLLVTVVLYKVAWKPILTALDKREETIRQSLENAEKARNELEQIESSRDRIIGEADAKANEVIASARKAAVEAAANIEAKAREESQILLDNARREIRTEQDKAMATLRKESADLAIELARKVIGDQLDEASSRKITDDYIQRI